MVDAHGASAPEDGVKVGPGIGHRLGARFSVRVERAESVARAVRGPVLVHGDDHGVLLRRLPARRLEALLPVLLLRRVRRAHDDDVEPEAPIHLLHRRSHGGTLGGEAGLAALRVLAHDAWGVSIVSDTELRRSAVHVTEKDVFHVRCAAPAYAPAMRFFDRRGHVGASNRAAPRPVCPAARNFASPSFSALYFDRNIILETH